MEPEWRFKKPAAEMLQRKKKPGEKKKGKVGSKKGRKRKKEGQLRHKAPR